MLRSLRNSYSHLHVAVPAQQPLTSPPCCGPSPACPVPQSAPPPPDAPPRPLAAPDAARQPCGPSLAYPLRRACSLRRALPGTRPQPGRSAPATGMRSGRSHRPPEGWTCAHTDGAAQ
eukprot:365632-Chlamydomonas_euryale.AAC.19